MVLTRSVGTFIVIGSRGVGQALNRLLRCIPLLEDIIRGQQGDEINRLPEWILLSQIFLRLRTPRDLARARCVCKQWNLLLSSLDFRHLWWEDCTDLERWLISSDLEDRHEIRWAAPPRLGCNPAIVPDPFLKSVGFRPTLEMASSRGLVCWLCNDKSLRLSIAVGNPRTRKWKMLPPPLPDDVPRCLALGDHFYSARFVHHDLLQQRYALFFLYICPITHVEVASLYDSRSAAWQRVHRHPMPRDRFCTGLRDASVRVVDVHYVHMVEEVVRDEVSMIAYDSYENSWDEIGVRLWHPFSGHDPNTAIPTGGNCYTRHTGDAYTIIHHVSLRAHGKDDYCRLLVVDGRTGRIGLWQFDYQSSAFQLISTIQQLPKWSTLPSQCHVCDMSRLRSRSYVLRSDNSVFMAMFIYYVWSWLIVYDVGRSLWLIAHSYGDSSAQVCKVHFEGCRWPLLEYDVQWHDSATAIEGCDPTQATIVAASGRRRLHLVHVPDIWSFP
jgi:hypothetical protein